MQDILILGGLVVNGDGATTADVLLRNGKVSRVSPVIDDVGTDVVVIDAQGKHVMPGGVDPHVHLTPYADDFGSGSRAALAGGVTTIGVMAFPDGNQSIADMLEHLAQEGRAGARVDVVFHSSLNYPGQPELSHFADIKRAGQTTAKLFTCDSRFDARYPDYFELFREARQQGVLPFFHCEDDVLIAQSVATLERERDTSIARYEESRPIVSEELAVQKVLALCELTGCPVYIVHISSARALAACAEARKRGLPVLVETRPIYLHLNSDSYRTLDGPLFVSAPPIRNEVNRLALWEGLKNGTIDTVGSDHAPLNRDVKFKCGCTIHDPQPGMANLQEMLPMLYGEGVLSGTLSPERFVQVTSANAAKILNIYPRKGTIFPGADADLAIWDPTGETVIGATPQYSKVDHTIFQGRTVQGRLHATLKGGVVVFCNGVVAAELPAGEILARDAGFSGVSELAALRTSRQQTLT